MRRDGMGLDGLLETCAPLRGVEAQKVSPERGLRYRDVSRSISLCLYILH